MNTLKEELCTTCKILRDF